MAVMILQPLCVVDANFCPFRLRPLVWGNLCLTVVLLLLPTGTLRSEDSPSAVATATVRDVTTGDVKTGSETNTPKDASDADGLEKETIVNERRQLPAQPEAVKPSLPQVVRSVADSADQTLELTFDDLSFEMDQDQKFERSLLDPKVKDFDGARISLRGYIQPSFSQSGITRFVFVRDNKECCFGPGAALCDCVLVKLADGVKTDYTVRPITVEGVFYLKEYLGPDGKVWSIYRIKEGAVK